VNCYALFIAWFLSGTRHRARVLSPEEVSFLDRHQTPIFLAVAGWWGSGKISLLASKIFSNVVVTSYTSCGFLYLFSSANISPVRFVLHLHFTGLMMCWKTRNYFPRQQTVTDLLAAIFVAYNYEK